MKKSLLLSLLVFGIVGMHISMADEPNSPVHQAQRKLASDSIKCFYGPQGHNIKAEDISGYINDACITSVPFSAQLVSAPGLGNQALLVCCVSKVQGSGF